MQSRLAARVRHLYIQIELAPAQRAEVRHRPSKPTQMQHRLGKTRGLPQCQAKQVLERPTKLDGCIRELPTASAFATCRGKPAHTAQIQASARCPPARFQAHGRMCVVFAPALGWHVQCFAGQSHRCRCGSQACGEDSFISTSPLTISTAASTRMALTCSPSTAMPTMKAPTAPMPVQIV